MNQPPKPNEARPVDRFRQAELDGVALLTSAQQRTDSELLDRALTRLQDSLSDPSISDRDRARRLNNLGAAHFTAFQWNRSHHSIDAAIAAREASVALTSPTSPDLAQRQSALAGCLRDRFELLGNPDDINRAISVARSAVHSAGERRDTLAGARAGLSSALRVRYERLGGDADLDEAITQGRLAVALSTDRDHKRAGRLNNLSIALRDRYLQRGNDTDLDEALSVAGSAVGAPTDNPRHRAQRLTNYALTLRSRHIRHSQGGGLAGLGQPGAASNLRDIDAAIEALQQAVRLSADPSSGFRMSKLAAALLTRYEATQDNDDLISAVRWARDALRGTDLSDRDLHSRLNDLMYALTKAAITTHSTADANEAVQLGARLLATTAPGSANRALYLTNLGLALRAHYEVTGNPTSIDAAIGLWREAATTVTSVTPERINAAIHWALCANWMEPGSSLALDGFRQVIDLIPTLVWHGIARTSRERVLRDLIGLGSQAVAAALAGHRPDLGLSLSEGSRGVLWSQLLDNRADLTALSRSFPELAERLGRTRAALDRQTAVSSAEP